MKLITTENYNKMKWLFISSHYDIHLKGLCYYNNQLCYFETDEGDYNEVLEEFEESLCRIYYLSFKERLKWKLKQKIFGWLVIIGLIRIEKMVFAFIIGSLNGSISSYLIYIIKWRKNILFIVNYKFFLKS